MTKFKPFIVLTVALVVVTLMIPALLVLPFSDEKASGKLGEDLGNKTEQPAPTNNADAAVEVAIWRAKDEKIEKTSLDNYLIGVVAAEMPAEFEMEALKAQALTARTYIVKEMTKSEKDRIKLPQGAQVDDTEIFQVYKNKQELKQLWGKDYNWKIKKITEAVKSTSGQVLTYNGQPITATFFSTSNGYTENSEAIWPSSFPYLRSVESPWDKSSPKFTDTKIFSVPDFESKLGVKLSKNSTIGEIKERTAGKRVGKVDINGKVISGKAIREKLGLKSTDFSWVRKGSNIIISTKGFGHGVGMSQYGANGMATDGKKYEEIVKYYYQGIEISSSDAILAKATAKK